MRTIITLCLLGLALNQTAEKYAMLRDQMVKDQIEGRGIRNQAVLRALRNTPRHLFVPTDVTGMAYEDHPLPIGHEQTISQPYIVAAMTEMLDAKPQHKVLEIGTGSGYQTAVLAQLCKHVFSIEIVPELARKSSGLLASLGHRNVSVRAGDGYRGWPEEAPFDRIILTAAPPSIPEELVRQLRPGGRLVAPEGKHYQELVIVDKDLQGKVTRRSQFGVRFVPMVPSKN